MVSFLITNNMAAPISLSLFRRCFPAINSKSGVFNIICRDYRPKQKKHNLSGTKKGPRQSFQYPYTPGDPIQEEQIEELDSRRRHAKTKITVPKNNKFVSSHVYDESKFLQDKHMRDTNKHVSQYGHIYEKLKEGDLRLGRTILNAKSSKDSGTILLEGLRLIRDSISLGAELKHLYFSTEDILKDLPPSALQDAQIFKILYKDMKTWSDTSTPSGILGVFKMPEQGECYTYKGPRVPLTVILDGVKDPGNVGTLMRTAAAVGCERILLLKGCANVWESKVLRSGMGSHFAVPIFNGLSWSQVYSYVGDSTHVFLADARTENDVVVDFDKEVSIEHVDDASSRGSDVDDDSLSDSDVIDSKDEKTSGQNDKDIYSRVPFPVISYTNMILHASEPGKEESVALVISNETEGLSPSAKKFAYNCYGTFVTVPMNEAVDSLNTAVAGSIILYEIRRKMLEFTASSSER